MEDQTKIKTKQEPLIKFTIFKKWWPKICWISLIILLLLSVFRIPYIGQFFDSVLFSFLFGYAKYILYIYLLVVCSFKLFNFKVKALYQKRFILLILVATTLISICFGGIEIMVNSQPDLINYYINNIWHQQIWNFDNHFVYGLSNFVDGGLIGTLFASIAGVFIILFSLILLAAAYFTVFKTHWTWILNKFNQLLHKKLTKQIEVVKTDELVKPYIETLINNTKSSDLNFDETVSTNINIDNEATLFGDFLKDNNISFSRIEKNENEVTFWLVVKTSVDQLAKINALKDSFKLIGLSQEYHLICTDEIIKIEYPKTKPVLNHVLKKFLCTKIITPLEFPLAVSENYKPVILNLQRDYLFGIFDPKHNNVNNFVNALIASISSRYDTKNLTITYLNPVSDKKHLLHTDLCHTQQILGMSGIKTFLDAFELKCNDIKQALKLNEVDDIYALNSAQKEIYKNQIIIIDYFDYVKLNDMATFNQIKVLFALAGQCGISFFCIDQSMDGITNDDLQYQITLGFAMDSRLSKKLFDSSSAATLDKLSQAILCKPVQKLKMKVVIPNISNQEFQTLTNRFSKIAK